ncbi:hypothetical protein [Taylorella asinigenitalis]|nr:hypothetical protein [Taylorella asinigenitalis]
MAMAMASSKLMPPSPGKSAFAVASDVRSQVGGGVGASYQW